MSGKMTKKMKAFCEEYLIDRNATRAAKAAGYSERTAYATGYENLKKPQIQEYLRERIEAQEEKFKEEQSDRIATQEEILEFFTDAMRSDDLQHSERRLCAEDLAKYYALFKDRVQVEHLKLEEFMGDG